MRIHIIACRVFTRSLSAVIYDAPHTIDVTWLPQGLHNTPQVLHRELEKAIDQVHEQVESRLIRRPDCIVLGYGLCANAVVGLKARDIPLVVPRTDDCIALFMGSQSRYLSEFAAHKGTFWLTGDWVDSMPEIGPDYREVLYRDYLERYGDEDLAEGMVETSVEMLGHYSAIGYIESPSFDSPQLRERARGYAGARNLDFFETPGDETMIRKIANGDFPEDAFLAVPPGFAIRYSDGPERMVAVPEGA